MTHKNIPKDKEPNLCTSLRKNLREYIYIYLNLSSNCPILPQKSGTFLIIRSQDSRFEILDVVVLRRQRATPASPLLHSPLPAQREVYTGFG
ncbi:hypothetical protein WAI453_006146 [Rhynchosporium graminicola]